MLLSKLGLHLEETDHLLISHGLSLSFKLIHIRIRMDSVCTRDTQNIVI